MSLTFPSAQGRAPGQRPQKGLVDRWPSRLNINVRLDQKQSLLAEGTAYSTCALGRGMGAQIHSGNFITNYLLEGIGGEGRERHYSQGMGM